MYMAECGRMYTTPDWLVDLTFKRLVTSRLVEEFKANGTLFVYLQLAFLCFKIYRFQNYYANRDYFACQIIRKSLPEYF